MTDLRLKMLISQKLSVLKKQFLQNRDQLCVRARKSFKTICLLKSSIW